MGEPLMIIAEAPQLIELLLDRRPGDQPSSSRQAIHPGNRNTTLTSIAGRLRRRGASREALENALGLVNSGLDQPLPVNEVESIAASVSRYETAPDLTEQGVSDIFAGRYKGRLCYSPSLGWLLFDGKVWRSDLQGLCVQEAVKQLVDELHDAIDADLKLTGEMRSSYAKQVRALRRNAPIANIAKLARSAPELIDADEWPDRPYLLNFQNGTLDLRAMEFRNHDPLDRLRNVLPYAYKPEAEAPLFVGTLNDALDEESVKFLLRLYGYALAGKGGEQKLAVFVGAGKNGKSTIAEAIRHAFSSYATTANPETFMRQHNKPAINNDVAALCGVRLVTTSELSSDQKLDSALVKRMTGGERLKARFLHKEFFEFDFKALIVMVSNFSPLFDASDTGIARRLLFLPFDRIIPDDAVDEDLPVKLLQEAPGIMNLLLQGYQDYRTRGLDAPEAVRRKTAEILKDHNQALRFAEDRCVLDPAGRVMARDLYSEYETWSCLERIKPMSERYFKAAIERTFSLQQKRVASGQVWQGIRLKSGGNSR
jgi:putative DNA primase/helicase